MSEELRRKLDIAANWAVVTAVVTSLAAGYIAHGLQIENIMLREQLKGRGSCTQGLPKPMMKVT